MFELTLRVELFKSDGSKVNFDGKPLIYGDLCPGCGPNRLDVSGKLSPPVLFTAADVDGNAGFGERLYNNSTRQSRLSCVESR